MKRKITALLSFVLCLCLCACVASAPDSTSISDVTVYTPSTAAADSDTVQAETELAGAGTDTTAQTEAQSTDVSTTAPETKPPVTETPVTETDKPEAKPPTIPETSSGITPLIKTDKNPSTDGCVKLVMVGDILMHDPILEYGKTNNGYSFYNLFENVKSDIKKADIAMLNQEVIISGEKYGIDGYPRFNSPFELADAIADAGFDVACHATNHTLDKGAEAMRTCLDMWGKRHAEVTVVGMHDSKSDAETVCIIEKNGIKIAMLNYTYGLNGAGNAAIEKEPYLVDMLVESEVKADLAVAEKYADFTVVSVHWGNEYTHTPSSSQKKWAEIFLDGGADLVLGTHPHVLQPVEWLEGENGERMLVYWSLGNFINCTESEGKGIGDRMLGALADVTVERGSDGKVKITSAYAVPLITHIELKQFGITTYKFSDYTEKMLSESEAVKKDSTLTYAYAKKQYEDMFGSFIK